MKKHCLDNRKVSKKGFTIIELVVVVVILSLLALILLPNMTSYKERANKKRIQTEMAGVYTVTKSALDEAKLPGSMFDEYNKATGSFSKQLDDFTNLGSEKLGRYEFGVVNDKLTLFYQEEGKWYVYDGTFFEVSTELPSYDPITDEDTTGSEIIPEPAVFLVQFLSEEKVEKIQYVKSGENATPPTLYREGYTFAGWDESYEGITSNTTINAQWEKTYDKYFKWMSSNEEGSYEAINEEGNGYYQYTGSETTVRIPHEINGHPMTSYYRMFEGTSERTSVEKVISDNSNIIDMSGMFRDTTNDSQATSLDLSNFDTSSVINMRRMFQGNKATIITGLNKFDTSNVTDMSGMFAGSQATELDLSSFDTSKVTDMSYMFNASRATELNLSNFDTSNVTTMRDMFYNSKATTLDLSSFNTSKVTSMLNMFRASKATELDLSSFDTSKVANVSNMFQNSQVTSGYARTQADADKFNNSSNKPSSLTFVAVIDFSGSPGPKKLIAGDMNAGYFGIVPASELITGDALTSMVGISEGTSQFSSEGWLKFAYQGKIQFVAKKPIRYSISWISINDANCVYGAKTVTIGGLTYKVRLMRGANQDPAQSDSGSINHNSEWNKLMLPIHIEAKNKNWAQKDNVETNVPYWGIDFTDADLHTHSNHGRGSYSWCQEKVYNDVFRLYRAGWGGVSNSDLTNAALLPVDYGWRPVLELVE